MNHVLRARALAGLTELAIEANLNASHLVSFAGSSFDELRHLEVTLGYTDGDAAEAFARTKGFAKLKRCAGRFTRAGCSTPRAVGRHPDDSTLTGASVLAWRTCNGNQPAIKWRLR